MTKDNYSWAYNELEGTDFTDEQKKTLEAMLSVYWKAADPTLLEPFITLAKGESLKPEEPEFKWFPAQPGNLYVRDIVRVREDAYNGPPSAHNGRVGVVVGIRYGTVNVHYTDGNEAPASFTQHRLPFLEKRY